MALLRHAFTVQQPTGIREQALSILERLLASAGMQACTFHRREVDNMTTVIAMHDVDDVAHWLSSPKRAEFFGTHGMTVRTFVSTGGGSRVGIIIENVFSLDALNQALQSAEAAEAMKHDRVRPETVELFVAR
jgi:hypothetical protein